jgi:predicted nucleic acid-binding protein
VDDTLLPLLAMSFIVLVGVCAFASATVRYSPVRWWLQIDAWVQKLDEFEFVEIDKLIVKAALIGVEKYKICYWDSALLAQAERFGAETFFTEDLNHDQMYGSVRARNPFRDS